HGLQCLGSNPLSFLDEAEQDVLGTNVLVVEHPCLFLRQNYDAASTVRKPLEHESYPLDLDSVVAELSPTLPRGSRDQFSSARQQSRFSLFTQLMGVYAGSEQVENVACVMNFLGGYQTCKTGIDKHCSLLKLSKILSIPALEGRLLLSRACFLIVSVRNG